MLFIVVLVLSALAIAGAAAFFSVYGLAQVFAGAFLSVVIMGIALESGKLVAASFLYRYWDKTTIALKAYLMAAVLVLMCITSMGISGYLTAAYQTDTVSLRDADNKITSYQEELDRLLGRKAEMDRQISQLPPNYVTARQRLMKSFQSEYDTITPRIEFLQKETNRLKEHKITTEAKVGPIIFISKVLGAETDDAIFWLVILLVCVFDPLAVALTICANIAISEHKKKKETIVPDKKSPVISNTIHAARQQAVLERDHQQA